MKWIPIALIAFAIVAPTAARSDDDFPDGPKVAAKANEDFGRVLGSVDRIVVLPPEAGADDPLQANKVLFEVRGHELVASLGETVQFSDWSPLDCMCFGTVRMEFFHGDRYLFACTYKHFQNLNSSDGPWLGAATMSPEARVRFIEWFADHGYVAFRDVKRDEDGCVKRADEAWQGALKVFPADAKSLFPPRDESFFPGTEENAAKLMAIFPNRQDFIHACWHAIGALDSPPFGRYNQETRNARELLEFALGLPLVDDFQKALESMPADDSFVWTGAFSWLFDCKKGSSAETIRGAWIGKLAEHAYQLQGLDAFDWKLDRGDRKAEPNLLPTLVRAVNEYGFPSPASSTIVSPFGTIHMETSGSSVFADVLMVLARSHYEPARVAIANKLPKAPSSDDRLALEVALAIYDGTPDRIRPEHLRCRYYDVPYAAWKLITVEGRETPGLDFAAAGAQCNNYETQSAAEEILRKRGLAVISKEDTKEDPDITRVIKEYSGEELVQRLNEKIASAASRKTRAELLQHRGRAYLEMGRYEDAWNDLSPGGVARTVDATFAAQSLGRFDAADDGLRRMLLSHGRDIEKPSDILFRRGCVKFAQEHFEEAARYFTASLVVEYGVVPAVFEHLVRLHMGSAAHSVVSTDGTFSHDKFMPYAALGFLRGNLTEKEVLQSVEPNPRDRARDLADRALARFVLAESCRLRGDKVGERAHLEACVATRAFDSEPFSLATLRLRQLEDDQGSSVPVAPVAPPPGAAGR
jgi:tetratricopeptide (TPR) repeat protein